MLSPISKVRNFAVVDAQPDPIELCCDPGKGEDSRAEVFPRWHQLPVSKMLTVYLSKPFNHEARYTRRRRRCPTSTCNWAASR
ncbi:heat shock protein 110, putative [Ixodes scapularis]|uniref:Heat shock protein 110, putative n=1 Tax=Ixodes scapularis TaxID=6945 RepID=B7PPX2_IXOSC|nr:heat shock protein 110, putative [Ixodes scapularis]|eukprot:XP_002435814.1 heat shock protein 110, putative [Ixodes scapularis]